jgi:hypothetical protein
VFISNGYLTKRNEGGRKTKWVYGEEGRKTKWVYGEEGMGRDKLQAWCRDIKKEGLMVSVTRQG